jgi:hypothetical protein
VLIPLEPSFFIESIVMRPARGTPQHNTWNLCVRVHSGQSVRVYSISCKQAYPACILRRQRRSQSYLLKYIIKNMFVVTAQLVVSHTHAHTHTHTRTRTRVFSSENKPSLFALMVMLSGADRVKSFSARRPGDDEDDEEDQQ